MVKLEQDLLAFYQYFLGQTTTTLTNANTVRRQVSKMAANSLKCTRKTTYIAACIQDSNVILTTITMFRGPVIKWD